MDRKTAIEWIEQIKHRIYGGDEDFDRQRKEALDMAIVDMKICDANNAGWISVKDRLPVKNANVLWWCEIRDRHMGHVRIGFFEGVTNHDIPEVSCCAPNCIPMYWMPLPEPPKEET